MSQSRAHWDGVYGAKTDTELSWHQARPERSLALIEAHAPDRASSIIDVGGGASTLVDALLAEDYRDITVLDVSSAALERARKRLAESPIPLRVGAMSAASVSWIVADITQWRPQRKWDVWHDRACFHFLTEQGEQDRYIEALGQATGGGSIVIIAGFAPEGPERCSGLPVQRYSAASLADRLGPDFALIAEEKERHLTPWGAGQAFFYAVLKRRGS